VEATVWVAVIGLLGLAGGWFVNQRKLKADVKAAEAEATRLRAEAESVVMSAVHKAIAAVQDTYQELLADANAQVAAVRQEAALAVAAARDARSHAQEAENQAWHADMRARAMERFLMELRPLIAAHVPGAEAILERLDKLTSIRL